MVKVTKKLPSFLGRDIGKMAADAKTIFENTHIVRDLEEVEI